MDASSNVFVVLCKKLLNDWYLEEQVNRFPLFSLFPSSLPYETLKSSKTKYISLQPVIKCEMLLG